MRTFLRLMVLLTQVSCGGDNNLPPDFSDTPVSWGACLGSPQDPDKSYVCVEWWGPSGTGAEGVEWSCLEDGNTYVDACPSGTDPGCCTVPGGDGKVTNCYYACPVECDFVEPACAANEGDFAKRQAAGPWRGPAEGGARGLTPSAAPSSGGQDRSDSPTPSLPAQPRAQAGIAGRGRTTSPCGASAGFRNAETIARRQRVPSARVA